MMISTKGRYALRVMVDLAEHETGGYITLKDIAERQELSEKYLESIISVLAKADFLEGQRGKGGGYRLTKSPARYTVGSIIKLTEGTLSPISCPECMDKEGSCVKSSACRTLPMWKKLGEIIENYLESVTLADLLSPELDGNDFVI